MQKQISISRGPRPALASVAAFVLIAVGCARPAQGQWTQWGGPDRNFTRPAAKLAESWPDDGPAKVWSREIEGGHSSILIEDNVLYTMCRRGERDAVLALKADTGETIWETLYDAPTRPNMALEFGPGPHSTPLIVEDRIYTVGAMTQFHCLDKRDGKILWSHDLEKDYSASYLLRGYGASPIAYKDTVIISTGPGRRVTEGAGLTAFKQDTGEVVWKSERFGGGYPSPIIVNFEGRDILINALGMDRFALDPGTGETLWKTQVDMQSAGGMATPLWIAPDKVFFTAAYGGGSRLYQLSTDAEGKLAAAELWHCRKLRIQHANAICQDGYIYGTDGDFGPAFLMAVSLETGKIKWRKRGFAKSALLGVGGKLLILDERGILSLATATPEGLEVHSRAKLLEEKSWTSPTLAGTRLYLRDYHTIMCLELGQAGK